MTDSRNKRIAKNTLFLYLRMVVTMAVTLYTSRVVLSVLGIEDYGVYSLIFGFVVLLGFLQTAMTSSAQRFITFELGRGDDKQVNRVFSMSVTVHITISIIILLLSETIGLWFINNQLNIPEDRIIAANWIYQFSIFIFITSILRTPYNATIIAYENMSFYAYVSIVETILKLSAVFLLIFLQTDKLITYGLLLLFVSINVSIAYVFYCKKKFNICNYEFNWDKGLYWELMNFSGWSMLTGIANVGAQQGGNILMNIYGTLVANASFGIANQVSQAVYAFSSSFQKAFYPQITKMYAADDKENLKNLVFRSSLFSYYLILIIAIPFLINAETVLNLWLKNVPHYAVSFCILMVVYQMIDASQAPLNILISSTGRIKNYNIWLSSFIFLNIPISWYLLSIGKPPYFVLIIRVSLNILTSIFRTIYIKSFMGFPSHEYFIKIVLKVMPVTVLSLLISSLSKNIFTSDLFSFIGTSIISFFLTIALIYLIGINPVERSFIKKIINNSYQNILRKIFHSTNFRQ
jgi:O-antigen/teichoic acid export membrane protein